MKPQNRAEFSSYCLRKLGKGVIELNLDPDQIEDRIDEALDYWRTFHHDATIRTYMKHQITATDITNQYIPINNNVLGVTRIFPANGSSGSGRVNMFDLRYQIRMNDFISFRATEHLDFYLIGRYLQQVDDFFVGEVGLTFNRHTDRLQIHWDWSVDAVLGEYIILETLIALDGDTYPDIWSDRMLQKYATALIKQQWGTNMKKFTGVTLLGGAVLDGQTIFNEASDEIKELELQIRSEYELPPAFIVG